MKKKTMKPVILAALEPAILAALCVALSAAAAVDALSIPTGAEVRCPFGAKVLGVSVLSTVPDGTAAVKAVSSWEETGLSTNVAAVATNVSYTVVSTQLVAGAWATVTNTVPFDPSPWGMENWVSVSTNASVAYATNIAPRVLSRVVSTNAPAASVTCSGGSGTGAAGGFPYVSAGDVLFVEGTAKGRAVLFLER